MTETVKPNLLIGIIVFLVILVLMVFVAAPMQLFWGMWGLALTELMFLSCAIVPALVFGWDLREIFKFSRPTLRQIFGVLVLWLGAYLTVAAVTMAIAYLFPEEISSISNELLQFLSSVPFPLTLFIAAVMPAVCEEALHRGLILHTFRGKNKWVTMIGMGLIFGIFHLDPYRFLGTAILGVILTLIMIETQNILLPVLFHFVNNAFSSFSTLVNEPGAAVQPPLGSVGIYLILTAAVPFLLMAGSRLLKSKAESRSSPISKKAILAAVAAAVILAAAGTALTIASSAQ